MIEGVCAACGDSATRQWDGRTLCYQCFHEIAHENLKPAVYWILYGDAMQWLASEAA